MKIKFNLKKLAEVQKTYDESRLCTDALSEMIRTVLVFSDTSYELAPNNVKLSIETLVSLGILKEISPKSNVQQINS